MWKNSIALTMLLLNTNVVDASTSILQENQEEAIESYATDYEYYFEPLTLLKETYDGEAIIRHYQYDDSEKLTLRYIDLPSSITSQVDVNEENAVAKVTAKLAEYYIQKDIDNIPSLNELLLAYTPDRPFNKISVSEEYAHAFAENLKYVLNTLETHNAVEIPKDEKETLTETYNNTNHPYKTKEQLLTATWEFYEEIRIKWYEKPSTYFFIGAALSLVALLSFLYIRDIKTKNG